MITNSLMLNSLTKITFNKKMFHSSKKEFSKFLKETIATIKEETIDY